MDRIGHSRFGGRWLGLALFVSVVALLAVHPAALAADVTPLEKAAFGEAMLSAMANGDQALVCRNLLAVVPGDDTTNAKILHGGKIESLSANGTGSRRRLAGMHGEEVSEGRCGAIG